MVSTPKGTSPPQGRCVARDTVSDQDCLSDKASSSAGADDATGELSKVTSARRPRVNRIEVGSPTDEDGELDTYDFEEEMMSSTEREADRHWNKYVDALPRDLFPEENPF